MHMLHIKGKHGAIGLWSLIAPQYGKSRGNMNVNDLVMEQGRNQMLRLTAETNAPDSV